MPHSFNETDSLGRHSNVFSETNTVPFENQNWSLDVPSKRWTQPVRNWKTYITPERDPVKDRQPTLWPNHLLIISGVIPRIVPTGAKRATKLGFIETEVRQIVSCTSWMICRSRSARSLCSAPQRLDTPVKGALARHPACSFPKAPGNPKHFV